MKNKKSILTAIIALLAVLAFGEPTYKVDTFDFGDAVDPCILVRYIGDESIHTIAMDNDGGGSSEAEVTVTIGTVETTIDCNAATGDTLTEVIALINAATNSSGVAGTMVAVRGHGLNDMDTGNDDFVDQTLYVSRKFQGFMYRDVSEVTTGYSHRLRYPLYYQGSTVGGEGPMSIQYISGYVDIAAGVSDVYLIQDQGTAAEEKVIAQKIGLADGSTSVEIFDFSDAPRNVNGPIAIEIVTTNDIADVTIQTQWAPVK